MCIIHVINSLLNRSTSIVHSQWNEAHFFNMYYIYNQWISLLFELQCTLCSMPKDFMLYYVLNQILFNKKNVAMTTLYCFYFLSTKTILIIYPVKLHLLSLLGSRWLCYVYVKYWFPSLNKIKLIINIPNIHVFSSGQCLIGCTRARPCSSGSLQINTTMSLIQTQIIG